MARLLVLITILSSVYTFALASEFIDTACKKTLYPEECIKTLMPEDTKIGQRSLNLAKVALTITLTRSEQLESFLNTQAKKPGLGIKEHAALKACLDGMDDITDQLTQSVNELDSMSQSSEFMFHKSNVQTWVSAVLTDHSTCVEGFTESGVDQNASRNIREKVVALEHDTSIALALINNIQGPE